LYRQLTKDALGNIGHPYRRRELTTLRVKTCKWLGDCFIYTNANNRLSYLIGDQSHVINHFDQGVYLLGYLPSHNRIYVADKDMGIYSYSLSLTVIEYQSAILRGDQDAAAEILPSVPAEQRNKIARFLEAQGKFSAELLIRHID
jgi:coatomer subunit beta'